MARLVIQKIDFYVFSNNWHFSELNLVHIYRRNSITKIKSKLFSNILLIKKIYSDVSHMFLEF